MPLGYTINWLVEAVGGTLSGPVPEGWRLTRILTDSRLVAPSRPQGGLFVALTGPRHDGHRYLTAFARAGIEVALVSRVDEHALNEGLAQILVSDTLEALQRLAAAHRSTLALPVVGITGSNGKTIVKEWLAELAASVGPFGKSPKSFNSQVGVPLSVLTLAPHHRLGLIEAGISRVGEMAALERVIQPTVGVMTHLGPAHQEGFESLEQKFDEKAGLFAGCAWVVYPGDDEPLASLAARHPLLSRIGLPYRAEVIGQMGEDRVSLVDLSVGGHRLTLPVAMADRAMRQNLLTAAAAALMLGISQEQITEAAGRLSPVPMRMEWIEGRYGTRLLDDTYTHDLDGLRAALEPLALLGRGGGPRMAILSDPAGVPRPIDDGAASSETNAWLREYWQALEEGGIEQVFLVGGALMAARPTDSPIRARTFKSTHALLEALPSLPLAGGRILIKGSRADGLERVRRRLELAPHETALEVDLTALGHNLGVLKAALAPGVRVMTMVKASAYGSGSPEVARYLAYHGVDYLGVAYAAEGEQLRAEGITLPIMVLNARPADYQSIIEARLEPVVSDREDLAHLLYLAGLREPGLPPIAWHLELDTGMNRLGLLEGDEAPYTQDVLTSQAWGRGQLRLASLFTHLRAADDPKAAALTQAQLDAFKRRAGALIKGLGQQERPWLHALNSPGVLGRPVEDQMDMVRLGLALYGIDPRTRAAQTAGEGLVLDLVPVSRLVTRVARVARVPAGQGVSYGQGAVSDRDRWIATLSIGYADGISRRLGHGAYSVRIGEYLAPTVGAICMDMLMVDVTDHPGGVVAVGERAVLFDDTHPLVAMAAAEGTIPYEILARIGPRVRRLQVSY